LITHEFEMTGASWLLWRLGRYLVERGHSVSVLADPKAPGSLRERFVADGMPVVAEVAPESVDLAIANTIYVTPVLMNLVSRTRTLWWVREGEIGIKPFLHRAGWGAILREVTHLVFQTKFQRDEVYRSFIYDLPPEKISIIPSGVGPIPSVAPVPRRKAYRIVCVGAIYPRKRQIDLIRAVVALERDDVECVLLGQLERPLPNDVQAVIAARPDVFHLPGLVDRKAVHSFYAGADIFSLPSLSESQAVSAYEAGCHGLPLVLSDLPCYRDIWRHGHNCLLHPVGDSQMLAGMLSVLLRDANLRQRLGQAAANTANSPEFRFENFTRTFEALIGRLLGMAKPVPKRNAPAK